MNEPARPRTTRDRDRAVARIRAITAGTAIAGFVATAGFGALSASNYSGQPTAAGGTGTAAGSSTVVTAPPRRNSDDESSTFGDGTTSNQGSPSLQAPITVPMPAFGGGRVTSGGS